MRWLENRRRDPHFRTDSVADEVNLFHQGLAGYEPTPLTELPGIAAALNVGAVFAKEESDRLGLPAFKALGASWAIHQALQHHEPTGHAVTFVTASDGNHGRAVAHFASLLGHRAQVFLPKAVTQDAVAAIRGEGAEVSIVDGSYDDAVAEARRLTEVEGVLIQDTAWEGYVEVPGWIVAGYSTLFAEVDNQLADLGVGGPDLVTVPTGVGSLLQAALVHYRRESAPTDTVVVSVEPVDAACVFASVEAGRRTKVATGHTVMAGLNCGTLSTLAWPYIESGLDGCVTVTDSEARTAATDLAALDVDAGPCGAASLAAIRVLQNALPGSPGGFGLNPDSTVVLLVTEGVAANPWIG